jgi:hypothetical protein
LLKFQPGAFPIFLVLFGLASVSAQTRSPEAPAGRNQIFGGYSFFSNSFNGHSTYGSHQPLNGWNASFAAPLSPRFSIKVDASGYYGNSLGSPQHPLFFLGGMQYNKHFGKETAFLQALAGYGHLNSNWWGGLAPGKTNSFSTVGGGGLDTPLSPRLAFRVEGGLQYADFTIPDDQIRSLPNYFARISTGLVWRF